MLQCADMHMHAYMRFSKNADSIGVTNIGQPFSCSIQISHLINKKSQTTRPIMYTSLSLDIYIYIYIYTLEWTRAYPYKDTPNMHACHDSVWKK